MQDLFAKCGVDCGHCPWSLHTRKKFKTDEEFQRFADRCKEILGYRPMKSPCLTCQTPDEQLPKGAKIPLRNCQVRQCVDKIEVKNCAYCSRFPCEEIRDHGTQWTREKFEKRYGRPISEEDYLTFIEPFEGLKHLEGMRASLSPNDIVEATTVQPLEIRIVEFPEDLPFSRKETSAFKTLHGVLASVKRSSLGLADTDTFARQTRLKNRILYFLRVLWIFGRVGEFQEEDGSYLMVDAKTYMDNRGKEKNLAVWPYVEKVIFRILSEFGVQCERVLVEEGKKKEATTPMGYLRDQGWIMTMAFDEYAGGVAALKALQTYTRKLDGKYGKKAFRHFSDVDMRVLKGQKI